MNQASQSPMTTSTLAQEISTDQYCSLQADEIRLLTIGMRGNEMYLRTEVHNLHDVVEYDAISYVWGTAKQSERIPYNEGETFVTPNVYEMLHQLYSHRPCSSRPVWIDAVCIDQSKATEKAIQIPLMTQVFSKAAHVIVWLGIPTPETQAFLVNFTRVYTIWKQWVLDEQHSLQSSPRENSSMPPKNDDFWTGLLNILDHDWFRRLWTFQEILLAKRGLIVCGAYSIDVNQFLDFVVESASFKNYSYARDGAWQGLWIACEWVQSYQQEVRTHGYVQTGLIPVLQHALRLRKVADPVDRLWAITGLFEKSLQDNLKDLIMYSMCNGEEYWTVYTKFAKVWLEQAQSLDLLCLPPTIQRRTSLYPSWCPMLVGESACVFMIRHSWNVPLSLQPRKRNLVRVDEDDKQKSHERYVATVYNLKKLTHTVVDDKILRSNGFVVDTISEVVESSVRLGLSGAMEVESRSSMSEDSAIHSASEKWFTEGLKLAQRQILGSDADCGIPPEYLMVICIDHRIATDMEDMYRATWLAFTTGVETNGLNAAEKPKLHACYTQMKHLLGHSFFGTEGGRFGIATPGCKPGDKVCVLYGGHPLHILRWPTSDRELDAAHGNGPAQFVGVAYIPHLMEPHQSDAARVGEDEIFSIG